MARRVAAALRVRLARCVARANQIRVLRAQLKRDLHAGRHSIRELLLDPPELEAGKFFEMLVPFSRGRRDLWASVRRPPPRPPRRPACELRVRRVVRPRPRCNIGGPRRSATRGVQRARAPAGGDDGPPDADGDPDRVAPGGGAS